MLVIYFVFAICFRSLACLYLWSNTVILNVIHDILLFNIITIIFHFSCWPDLSIGGRVGVTKHFLLQNLYKIRLRLLQRHFLLSTRVRTESSLHTLMCRLDYIAFRFVHFILMQRIYVDSHISYTGSRIRHFFPWIRLIWRKKNRIRP